MRSSAFASGRALTRMRVFPYYLPVMAQEAFPIREPLQLLQLSRMSRNTEIDTVFIDCVLDDAETAGKRIAER